MKTHHIDWLGFTLHGDGSHHLFVASYREIAPDARHIWGMTTPQNGYEFAEKTADEVTIMWGDPRMGVRVNFSGQALTTLKIPADELLKFVFSIGGVITRLDIATDIIDTDLTVQDVIDAVGKKYLSTGRKKPYENKSADDGHTYYIGSRTSTFCMRIYNKQAERKAKKINTGKWVRFEAELKGKAAAWVANAILENGLSAVAHAMIERGVQPVEPDKLPERLQYVYVGSSAVETFISERADSNTKKWLLETCCKTLAKQSKIDPDIVHEFLDRLFYYQNLTINED